MDRVLRPFLREIELHSHPEALHVGVALGVRTDIGERDGDLAVLLLPSVPAVLTIYAHGGIPLLGVPFVIQGEDPVRGGEASPHLLREGDLDNLGGPGGVGDEVLGPMVGGGGALSDGFHRLDLLGAEEAPGVAARLLRRAPRAVEVEEGHVGPKEAIELRIPRCPGLRIEVGEGTGGWLICGSGAGTHAGKSSEGILKPRVPPEAPAARGGITRWASGRLSK